MKKVILPPEEAIDLIADELKNKHSIELAAIWNLVFGRSFPAESCWTEALSDADDPLCYAIEIECADDEFLEEEETPAIDLPSSPESSVT